MKPKKVSWAKSDNHEPHGSLQHMTGLDDVDENHVSGPCLWHEGFERLKLPDDLYILHMFSLLHWLSSTMLYTHGLEYSPPHNV